MLLTRGYAAFRSAGAARRERLREEAAAHELHANKEAALEGFRRVSDRKEAARRAAVKHALGRWANLCAGRALHGWHRAVDLLARARVEAAGLAVGRRCRLVEEAFGGFVAALRDRRARGEYARVYGSAMERVDGAEGELGRVRRELEGERAFREGVQADLERSLEVGEALREKLRKAEREREALKERVLKGEGDVGGLKKQNGELQRQAEEMRERAGRLEEEMGREREKREATEARLETLTAHVLKISTQ